MKYHNITEANFISRPNRFIAIVDIAGKELTVHVKNTGRCKELLLPGSRVYLEKASNPERKTPYDLVAVEHEGRIINIDSQAPNAVVKEWLQGQQVYSKIQPEYKYGNSRIDFYMEKEEPTDIGWNGSEKEVNSDALCSSSDNIYVNVTRYLMEVKGCTLFRDGVGYFPDAPTERGTKHLRELIKATQEGYKSIVAFVIQGEGIDEVRPNAETDPEFAKAFYEAKAAGVEVLFLKCKVKPDEIYIDSCD